MRYCEFCGQPVEKGNKCTCEEALAHRSLFQKINKKYLSIIIGSTLAVIVLLIVILSNAFKVDPFDYAEISFDGYNSIGTAVVAFDENELIGEFLGEEPTTNFYDLTDWYEDYEIMTQEIEYSYTPSENLSNGDVVTVAFTITGGSANKIASKSKEFTVTGLKEVELFDVFANVTVTFEGVSGEARVNVEKVRSDIMDCCQLNIEPNNKLKNGDKVVITAGNIDGMAEQFGVVPKETSKEYTVTNLSSYVTKASQLPNKTIQEFENEFLKEKQDVDNSSFIKYKNTKLHKTYFLAKKESAWTSDNNLLMIFVSFDKYVGGSFQETLYSPLVFKNIKINEDGTTSLNYEDGSNATFTANLERFMSEYENDFDIEELQ